MLKKKNLQRNYWKSNLKLGKLESQTIGESLKKSRKGIKVMPEKPPANGREAEYCRIVTNIHISPSKVQRNA